MATPFWPWRTSSLDGARSTRGATARQPGGPPPGSLLSCGCPRSGSTAGTRPAPQVEDVVRALVRQYVAAHAAATHIAPLSPDTGSRRCCGSCATRAVAGTASSTNVVPGDGGSAGRPAPGGSAPRPGCRCSGRRTATASASSTCSHPAARRERRRGVELGGEPARRRPRRSRRQGGRCVDGGRAARTDAAGPVHARGVPARDRAPVQRRQRVRWTGATWAVQPSMTSGSIAADHSKGRDPNVPYPNLVLGTTSSTTPTRREVRTPRTARTRCSCTRRRSRSGRPTSDRGSGHDGARGLLGRGGHRHSGRRCRAARLPHLAPARSPAQGVRRSGHRPALVGTLAAGQRAGPGGSARAEPRLGLRPRLVAPAAGGQGWVCSRWRATHYALLYDEPLVRPVRSPRRRPLRSRDLRRGRSPDTRPRPSSCTGCGSPRGTPGRRERARVRGSATSRPASNRSPGAVTEARLVDLLHHFDGWFYTPYATLRTRRRAGSCLSTRYDIGISVKLDKDHPACTTYDDCCTLRRGAPGPGLARRAVTRASAGPAQRHERAMIADPAEAVLVGGGAPGRGDRGAVDADELPPPWTAVQTWRTVRPTATRRRSSR